MKLINTEITNTAAYDVFVFWHNHDFQLSALSYHIYLTEYSITD